jgi:hypothetical protein
VESSGEASSAQVPILSSSGDAFGAQVSTIAHEDNEKGMKKKRQRDSSVFHSLVLEKTGVRPKEMVANILRVRISHA